MNSRGLTPKTSKASILNSPKSILFAKQRKNAKFLQYIFPHLVTLFSVCLRVFPFSKNSSKKFQPQIQFESQPNDHFFSPFS
jgi:hypothetical protein